MTAYTGLGDKGSTCILGKSNIAKDNDRIEALGCFDELNSITGVVIAFSESENTVRLLKTIQDDLHSACAELAATIENTPRITERHVQRIEKIIGEAEKFVAPQRSFFLPGGTKEAALLHFTRTVSRRAERQLVRLSRVTSVNPQLLRFANRLSSLYHILARVDNRQNAVPEEAPTYKYYERGKRP